MQNACQIPSVQLSSSSNSMRDGGLNGLCVCVQPTAECIMAIKAKCMKNHTRNDLSTSYTSRTVTYVSNARLYSRTNVLACLYFSLAAFILLIWQAYQHSCSETSQITIKTPPMSADSIRKRYTESIYRITSCSGSFSPLFSLFSPRFCSFSRFQRLGSVTAALGRVSAHCSATCAVIGWIAPKHSLPLAGALDWRLHRPFALCLCILLSRKSRISRNNRVSSGMTYSTVRLFDGIWNICRLYPRFVAF